MNILMLGGGKGSWDMRGRQLGAQLGARVSIAPTTNDFAWADVVVIVKRAILQFGRAASRSGKPIVWDALDFWGQPGENAMDRTRAIQRARDLATPIRPVLVIGATRAMAADVGGVYVPHHCWGGLRPTPPRATVRTVGYQGGEVFLGQWRPALERACRARGWTFVVNPTGSLADVDILVAFRDGPWDGWVCRQWKSGVKIANAICAGRPILTQPSAAAAELLGDGLTISSVDALDAALDACAERHCREAAFEDGRARAAQFSCGAVAAEYRALLSTMETTCTAA